jgi:hypothetical protein
VNVSLGGGYPDGCARGHLGSSQAFPGQRHIRWKFPQYYRDPDATPARIADHDGRYWAVQQVLGHWMHPDHRNGAAKVGYGIEAERWRLVVAGPLPYRPGRGEQHVAIRSYNDGASWYLILNGIGREGRPGDVSQTS